MERTGAVPAPRGPCAPGIAPLAGQPVQSCPREASPGNHQLRVTASLKTLEREFYCVKTKFGSWFSVTLFCLNERDREEDGGLSHPAVLGLGKRLGRASGTVAASVEPKVCPGAGGRLACSSPARGGGGVAVQ